MITPKTLRSGATALAIVLFACCCKKKEPDSFTRGPDGKPFVPGATHEEPATSEVDYDDLDYENDGSFSMDDVPFTGIALQHHDDDSLKARYHFLDGRLDGLAEEWYENGIRSTYKMYKQGLRDGITTYWDEAGAPAKQVLYRNDEEVKVIEDPEELEKAPIISEKGLR